MKRIVYVVCKFNMEVELPEDHAEDRPEVNLGKMVCDGGTVLWHALDKVAGVFGMEYSAQTIDAGVRIATSGKVEP